MQKGFTLIEMLIAMAITVVLAAAGTSISLRASRRKAVEVARDKLVSLLQQAKSNSQASNVGTCPTGTWKGWQVSVANTSAILQLVCAAGTSNTQTYPYPSGVTASPTPTILYKPLGAGTNLAADTTITLTGIVTQDVTVYTTGDIE